MKTTLRIAPYKFKKTILHSERLTVGQYLIKRLSLASIDHLFSKHEEDLAKFLETVKIYPKLKLEDSLSSFALATASAGYGDSKGLSCLAITQSTWKCSLQAISYCREEQIPLLVVLGKKMVKMSKKELTLFASYFYLQDELTNAFEAPKKIDCIIDVCETVRQPCLLILPDELVDDYIPQHTPKRLPIARSDQEVLQDMIVDIKNLLSKSRYPFAIFANGVAQLERELLAMQFVTKNHISYSIAEGAHKYFKNSSSLYCTHPPKRCDLLFLIGFSPFSLEFQKIKAQSKVRKKVILNEESAFILKRQYTHIHLQEALHHLAVHSMQYIPQKITLTSNKNDLPWYLKQLFEELPHDSFIVISRNLYTDNPGFIETEAPLFFPRKDISPTTFATGVQLSDTSQRPIIITDPADLKEHFSEAAFLANSKKPPIFVSIGKIDSLPSLFTVIEAQDQPSFARHLKIVLNTSNKPVIFSLGVS